MEYNYFEKIKIKGLRFLKIQKYNNQFILIASKLYKNENNIKKYALYRYLLNNNFELIDNSELLLNFLDIEDDYLNNLYNSLWCRSIYQENNLYYLIIDFNKNINNEYFESNNYLLETSDFYNFKMVKKYETNNIIHTEYLNNLFMSKIEKDPNNNWGKYLFEFKIDNKLILPNFDKYIDYDNDKGHLIHNIYYNNIDENYKIIFSILDKTNKYKIYESETVDFINFNNTKELIFNNFNTSEWFCFPTLLIDKNKYYILINQDDFGKESEPLLFRKENELLKFIEDKYTINYSISNHLNYEDNKKYIFLNEILNMNGNKYNDIIKNNKDINNYSTHSPSCIDLYNVLLELNINNESILDIGSGKGLALTIFNLFSFKKIGGIELSEKDYNICIENLNNLKINNIELENTNALDYNKYNEFDYLYFYNPFNEIIFEGIIKKINKLNIKIIYNNIHEKETNILHKYNFILIDKIKGINRDYHIFQKIDEKLKIIIDNNYIIKKEVIKNNESNLLIDFLFKNKDNIKLKKELNIQYFEKKGISLLQNTKHCFNNYLLDWNQLKNIPHAENIFNILKNNYETLTKQSIEHVNLYPQIIHYPSNGGFLDKHYHKYYPQLIGQVLLLKNDKNEKGGFYMFNDNKILNIHSDKLIDLSNEHSVNDLLIFRFNAGHGVFPTLKYKQDELNWDNKKWILNDKKEFIPNQRLINGRWIAVLTQI